MTDIEYDPADPTTFYFTMFDYGVFRATGNGATIQNVYEGAGPDTLGFGIRYEVAAAKLRNGRTRLYIHDGRNEVDANADGVFEDASRVLRTDDARAATPIFQMLSSERGRHARFQLVRRLRSAVLLRHADRRLAEGSRRRHDRRPDAIRRTASLRRCADRSNGRNIMLSRNAGVLFTDISGEPKDPFEANHPDVQILAFHPKNPNDPVHRQRRRCRPDEWPLRRRLVGLQRARSQPLRRRSDRLPAVALVDPDRPDPDERRPEDAPVPGSPAEPERPAA